jgi:voltage-gated potassium channel
MDARSERIAAALEPIMLVAAALTLPAVAIHESQPGASVDAIAVALNWATWIPFVIEIVVMLIVVPDGRRWLREHPLELAVVALTPPVLPPGLQSMRVIRLLRLLRLAQLSRRVFSLQGLRYAALLAALTIVAGGAAFVGFEHSHHYSDWTGIYWAITTMTTLGSNVYPSTTGSEIISVVIVVVGISFVALLTGALAQRFLGPQLSESEAEAERGEAAAEAVAMRQVQEIRDRLAGLEVALEQLVSDRAGERGADARRSRG